MCLKLNYSVKRVLVPCPRAGAAMSWSKNSPGRQLQTRPSGPSWGRSLVRISGPRGGGRRVSGHRSERRVTASPRLAFPPSLAGRQVLGGQADCAGRGGERLRAPQAAPALPAAKTRPGAIGLRTQECFRNGSSLNVRHKVLKRFYHLNFKIMAP